MVKDSANSSKKTKAKQTAEFSHEQNLSVPSQEEQVQSNNINENVKGENGKEESGKELKTELNSKAERKAKNSSKTKKTTKPESKNSSKEETKEANQTPEKGLNKEEAIEASKNNQIPAKEPNKEEDPKVSKDAQLASKEQNNKETKEEQTETAPDIQLQTNTIEKETIEELGISEEIINEKMKNVYELKNPKKRKKSTIINIFMLLINLVLMFFIVRSLFNSLDDTNIVSIFNQQGEKMWWLFGGLIMYIVFILIQVLMYRVLIKNLSGRKSWKIAYDAAIVGKYYDNITPFAVGGQAMQILRLTENGIGAGVSTSIPILKMMINSGVNALLALVFFVFGLPFIPKTSILNDILILLLEIVGVIGLIITVIMALFIFLISSGTLVTRTLISGVLRLGYKMKLVKDYRTTYKKVMNQVAEYKFSMSYLWKHKKILLQLIFYSVLECISYGSLAFFVAMAFTDNLGSSIYMFFFMCIVKYYLCSMASCYIPLPGGTGLMEISFILLFGMGLGNNMGWALLAWRFLTYYLIIIHGFGHELTRIFANLIKSKKSKDLKEPKKIKERKAE